MREDEARPSDPNITNRELSRPEIAFDELVRYMIHWQPARHCRNCNGEQFNISYDNTDGVVPVMSFARRATGETVGSRHKIVLQCATCGIEDIFDAQFVALWLRDNPRG